MRILGLIFFLFTFASPVFATGEEAPVVLESQDNRSAEKRYIKNEKGEFVPYENPKQQYLKVDEGVYKKDESKYDFSETAQVVLMIKRCNHFILKLADSYILADKFLCTSLQKGDLVIGNFNSSGYTDIRQGKFRCNILIEETDIETTTTAKKRLKSYCQ